MARTFRSLDSQPAGADDVPPLDELLPDPTRTRPARRRDADADEFAGLGRLARVATQPRLRPAARAVILDPEHQVLLVHFDFGASEALPTGLWACPGGGIEPTESVAEALRRELREEVGLDVDDIGPPIWHKEHVFPLGTWDGQRDTYYLVEVNHFEPRPLFSTAELRAEHVDALCWWPLAKLHDAQRTADAAPHSPTRPTFSPRRLGHLIADLLAFGPPAQPLRLER